MRPCENQDGKGANLQSVWSLGEGLENFCSDVLVGLKWPCYEVFLILPYLSTVRERESLCERLENSLLPHGYQIQGHLNCPLTAGDCMTLNSTSVFSASW